MRDGCGVGILGIGVCLPDTVRDNSWWPDEWRERYTERRSGDMVGVVETADASAEAATIGRAMPKYLSDLFRGARQRRVIDEDDDSSDLEVRACTEALTVAGLDASEIDLLIGHSQVPDQPRPDNHPTVAKKLGLRADLAAFSLNAACASFLPHVTVATRLIEAGDHRHALLYQSSAISRITDFGAPVSPTVGDGAVAEVIGPVPAGLGLVARVQRMFPEFSDALVLTPVRGDARWHEDSGGLVARPLNLDHVRRMGAEAPRFAREACGEVLERAGASVEDVDFFACTQPAAWYGETCARALGLPDHKWVPAAMHFQKYGHLMAASAALNLWVAWAHQLIHQGDLVLVYSPGVGFTTTASLIRWTLPDYEMSAT